jgi:hypothetical protein
MKRIVFAAAAALVFSAGTQAADNWGIEFEEATRIEAKVVDLLCEVTGDCVDNCGDGRRQLGLLLDDGRLVPVVKNFDIFAGATDDLIVFCGQRIVADGLMIEDPQMPMFALQFKRAAPDGQWSRATQWGKNWSAANGGQSANQWFRTDPGVLQQIEADGVFGIPGLEPEE